MSTLKGKVKWFNGTKGYGFIEREDKEKDVFVHSSAVRDAGLKYLKNNSEISTDLSSIRNSIKQNFKDLYEFVTYTDKSFKGAVKAQEKKQINGINKLEKRLIKAEKRKHKDFLNRI